jgi:hypothetical protein
MLIITAYPRGVRRFLLIAGLAVADAALDAPPALALTGASKTTSGKYVVPEGSNRGPSAVVVMPFDAKENALSRLSVTRGELDPGSVAATHWTYWSEEGSHLADVFVCLATNQTFVADPTRIRSRSLAGQPIGPIIDLTGTRGIVVVTALDADENAPSSCTPSDPFAELQEALIGSWTITNLARETSFGGDALGLAFGALPDPQVLQAGPLRVETFDPMTLADSEVILIALESSAESGNGVFQGSSVGPIPRGSPSVCCDYRFTEFDGATTSLPRFCFSGASFQPLTAAVAEADELPIVPVSVQLSGPGTLDLTNCQTLDTNDFVEIGQGSFPKQFLWAFHGQVIDMSPGTCGNPRDIFDGGTATGTTAGTSHQAGTCGKSDASPEQVFRYVPSQSGTAVIETCGAGTGFDTVLHVRDGGCGEPQLACNDDACANNASRIALPVIAGHTYFIFVDGFNGAKGNFTLKVTPPAGTCASPFTIPPEGGSFFGTTNGTSALTGTCGQTGTSPERVFQWTPAQSGAATIETCGSGTTFDTIVYMRNGSCTAGVQVGCNDDACANLSGLNRASRFTINVTAGQTYFIIVDGFKGAQGEFQLTVTPPGLSCPTKVTLEAVGLVADLDLGWSGAGHDMRVVHKGALTFGLACPGAPGNCGICTVNGPLASTTVVNNRRCTSNTALACTSDAQCAGGTCAFFATPPFPVAAGGLPVCVMNRVNGAVSGTLNPGNGATALNMSLVSSAHSGVALGAPCPNCSGPAFNTVGTCSAGPRVGQACVVHGVNFFFGNTSFDCPPNPGANVGDLTIPLNPTTGTSQLQPTNTCSGVPFSGKLCYCPGQTLANTCVDGICTVDGSGEGVCNGGPVDQSCTLEPFRGCLSNLDCPAPGDTCGLRTRKCQGPTNATLNTIGPLTRTGGASPTSPTLASTFCLSSTAAPVVNTTFGLPGPAALRFPANVCTQNTCSF